MTETLLFLGSGSSVPFGLPTMRGLVKTFEVNLEKNAEKESHLAVLNYYRDIKQNLQRVHDNVDLESINVLLAIERDTKYGDLPFYFESHTPQIQCKIKGYSYFYKSGKKYCC